MLFWILPNKAQVFIAQYFEHIDHLHTCSPRHRREIPMNFHQPIKFLIKLLQHRMDDKQNRSVIGPGYSTEFLDMSANLFPIRAMQQQVELAAATPGCIPLL